MDPDRLRHRRVRAAEPAAPPGRFVCRVCEAEQADGSYCAVCLADTMVPRSA